MPKTSYTYNKFMSELKKEQDEIRFRKREDERKKLLEQQAKENEKH